MSEIFTDIDGEDELEIARPTDFAIQRDEHGDLAPVYGRLPGTQKAIEFIPWPEGTVNKHFPSSMDINKVSNEQAAALLNNHLVTPAPEDLAQDGDQITEADIEENMKAFAVNPILMTMAEASGYDMFLSANYNEDAMEQVVEQFLSEAMGSESGVPADDGD